MSLNFFPKTSCLIQSSLDGAHLRRLSQKVDYPCNDVKMGHQKANSLWKPEQGQGDGRKTGHRS